MSHNEAIFLLDLLLHGAVAGVGSNAPPADPQPGECWLVGAAPEGAWSGRPHALAGWTEGGWRFAAPREGLWLWAGQEAGFALFTEGGWRVGEARGRLIVEGKQLVGPRGTAIVEPSGGMVVDAEARAAIDAVLVALRTHGLIESG